MAPTGGASAGGAGTGGATAASGATGAGGASAGGAGALLGTGGAGGAVGAEGRPGGALADGGRGNGAGFGPFSRARRERPLERAVYEPNPAPRTNTAHTTMISASSMTSRDYR